MSAEPTNPGTLYLIPVPIGNEALTEALPQAVQDLARDLKFFVAENPKSARAFLKQVGTKTPLQELKIGVLSEHTKESDVEPLLEPLKAGLSVGLLSEAGVPCVADPGSRLVAAAHRCGIRVQPLVGPSSLLLALMASGLEGQNFEFVGYLPVEAAPRDREIRRLAEEAKRKRQTKILIETPYRADSVFEALIRMLPAEARLCVAQELLQSEQRAETHTVGEWRSSPLKLGKSRCVFLFL